VPFDIPNEDKKYIFYPFPYIVILRDIYHCL